MTNLQTQRQKANEVFSSIYLLKQTRRAAHILIHGLKHLLPNTVASFFLPQSREQAADLGKSHLTEEQMGNSD